MFQLKSKDALKKKRRNIKLPITSNDDSTKVNGEFEKDIMDIDEEGKPAQHSFALETVEGTSFASPAVMSVFLLLNEFNEQEGKLLQASDIIRCMRATAWQKPYANESESLNWYGCGVVDGGKTLEACQMLINARKKHKEGRFEASLKDWKRLLTTLSQDAEGKYIFEIAETFKSQNSNKILDSGEREKAIEQFYSDFLKLYPYHSESEFQERLQAFILYESGGYEKSLEVLRALLGNNQDKDFARDSVELKLTSFLHKNKYSLLRSFTTALKEFEGWYDAFTEVELKEISSHTYPDGKTLFFDSGKKMRSGLILDEREGSKILNNLLTEINGGWSHFGSLGLVDIFERIKGENFLKTLLSLSKKLEPFILTSSQKEQIAIHVKRAEEEKIKFEEKTGQKVYLR